MVNNQLGSFRILIVDDEPMIQKLVLDVLRSLGFKDVVTANTGRRAIEIVAQQKFDFIITDWFMPDLDGIDLVKHIRTSPESLYPATPIIMLTGNTEAKYVLTAINAGINAYLIKPFSAAQMVQRIRNVIEHPRQFIIAPNYRGPDRRHADKEPPQGSDRRGKPRK